MKIESMSNKKSKYPRGILWSYPALFLVLLSVLMLAFFVIRPESGYRDNSPAIKIQGDFSNGEKSIRRDLEETAIESVVIYPNDDFPQEAPGIAMLSARDSRGIFITTAWGTPRWQKVVYYTLIPDPGNEGFGLVVRREGTDVRLPSSGVIVPDFVPSLAPHDPGKTVVVAGNIPLDEEGSKGGSGFCVRFRDAVGNTGAHRKPGMSLISVMITPRHVSRKTGKVTSMTLPVIVCPSN